MKNIIIVGLGKMGNSHLNSFLNHKSKTDIFIVEKNRTNRKKILKNLKEKEIKFQISKKIPKGRVFEFAIVSTPPNNRLQVIKELTRNNKIKYFLLEKFLFNRIKEYKEFSYLNSKLKIKTYVNVWSKKFLQIVNLKKKLKKTEIKVILPEKKILTNLIHFYEMFKLLTTEKINIDLSNFKIRKINKTYHDGNGTILLRYKNFYSMQLKSEKMPNNIIMMVKRDNRVKKIKVTKGRIIIYSNSEKKIKYFPLASRETCKFYQSIKNSKKLTTTFSNYKSIAESSMSILKSFKKQKNIEINIF